MFSPAETDFMLIQILGAILYYQRSLERTFGTPMLAMEPTLRQTLSSQPSVSWRYLPIFNNLIINQIEAIQFRRHIENNKPETIADTFTFVLSHGRKPWIAVVTDTDKVTKILRKHTNAIQTQQQQHKYLRNVKKRRSRGFYFTSFKLEPPPHPRPQSRPSFK
jgi:hypothetical protein